MSVVLDTLSFISKLERINLWTYKKIKPYIGKRIMEAGCGNGNLTSYLLNQEIILAVDNDDKMMDEFKERFSKYPNLKLLKYNLESPSIAELSKYNIDTIICINTLEHLKDEISALNRFNTILKEGNLILLVPAFQWLYCPLDKAAGHYRRYSLKEISAKVEKCGFRIVKKMYFNFFGIIGWFLNGKVLGRERLSTRLLWFFNFLMPFISLFENLTGPPIGVSIILICKKDI